MRRRRSVGRFVCLVGEPAQQPAQALTLRRRSAVRAKSTFSIPARKAAFTLTGFGSVNGLCTDVNGDVYVSDGHNGKLVEYPYSVTKPVRTLSDPGYYTQGCAIDLKTGDLAVAIQPMSSNPGGVAIFRHAKGKPHNYVGYDFFFPSFCTYDYKGNLFFDGGDIHGMFFFAELARHSKTLQRVTLPQSIQVAGGVQFDGQNVVVDDQGAGYKGSTLYEFSISGSSATETGTTPLGGSVDVIGFGLYNNRVIGPNIGSSPNVMYWRVPQRRQVAQDAHRLYHRTRWLSSSASCPSR